MLDHLGFLCVCAAGCLLHFVYDWTGGNTVVGLFAPVNESVFEHLKLLFFPTLVYAAIAYWRSGRAPGVLSAWCGGILWGMAVIVAVFYTYSGIIGRNFLWADILTFFLGVGAAFSRARQLLPRMGGDTAAIVVLLACAACIMLFTCYPPHIAFFRDPVSMRYGA